MSGILSPPGHPSRALVARFFAWEHDITTAAVPVHA